MIIEFSVENFRSIRYRQTLSMVAAPRLHKKKNTIDPQIDGEDFPALLKAAAIYGPNASGKSTLVKALDVFHDLARRKPTAEKEALPVAPFRFDPVLRALPSKFELHFVALKSRYTFLLAMTSERIYEEELQVYKKGKPVLLYSRTYAQEREQYAFGNALEGGDALHEAWRKLTGPQSLFLAQAVANSNEELTQLRVPFRWFKSLIVDDSGMGSTARFTQRLIADVPEVGAEVAEFLSDLDVPVSSIRAKITDGSGKSLVSSASINGEPKELSSVYASKTEVTTTLTHKTSLGEADFDFSEESDGTKNLIGFALPWFVFTKNVNADGQKNNVMIVEEIDSSLHPKLVEALIRRHLSSDIERQLIFTTHDTHLMDTKLLRRDQIWLMERDEAGATQLRCLHDFEGRESEDIEKRYYDGRYRGLPVIPGG